MFCPPPYLSVLLPIQVKKPSLVLPFFPSLPFPPSLLRHVFYIVLYCTILYYTVQYCTVLYCTVSSLQFPPVSILPKFICLETLRSMARLNRDILFSLIRSAAQRRYAMSSSQLDSWTAGERAHSQHSGTELIY